VILTLVSDIAADYYTLLQLDLQLQITQETVKTQTDSVRLYELSSQQRRSHEARRFAGSAGS